MRTHLSPTYRAITFVITSLIPFEIKIVFNEEAQEFPGYYEPGKPKRPWLGMQFGKR